MKVSVTSYSYSQLLRKGEITQRQMIALTKELGFDGIEFTQLIPEEGFTEEEYALELKRLASEANLPIISYTIGANLLAEDIEVELNALKHKVDIAALLGVKLMRHDIYSVFPENGPKDFDYYLDTVCDRIRMITEYAATKGVRTCTENHGMICQDADRVEKMINKVNNPNFGWLVDIGNFMCTNGDCAKSVEIGSKYVFHVHAKDFHTFDAPCDGAFATAEKKQYIQGAIVGEGVVPVKECIDILKNKGYNDYFTIEFEGLEDCVEALKKGMEFIKSCE